MSACNRISPRIAPRLPAPPQLFPERADYTDIYDHYGLLDSRAIYGHGIHLSEGELRRFP